jgi:ParB family chromosome partitioning protein
MAGGSTVAKSNESKKRLGRGLDSLMGMARPAPLAQVAVEPDSKTAGQPKQDGGDPPAGSKYSPPPAKGQDSVDLQMVKVNRLTPNPKQPRTRFEPKALKSLGASLKRSGMMQPIVATPHGEGFEIVAGERRWRAAQEAGIDEVPVLVRALGPQEIAELALIENIQREELNPLERAQGFATLAESFGMTHEQIAEVVGLNRSTISNHLRLLDLDGPIQMLLRHGQLDMGHGRALLGEPNTIRRRQLAEKSAREGWSVRRLESAVHAGDGTNQPSQGSAESSSGSRTTLAAQDLASKLTEHLGSRATSRMRKSGESGTLSLDFSSLDRLDDLCQKLGYSKKM